MQLRPVDQSANSSRPGECADQAGAGCAASRNAQTDVVANTRVLAGLSNGCKDRTLEFADEAELLGPGCKRRGHRKSSSYAGRTTSSRRITPIDGNKRKPGNPNCPAQRQPSCPRGDVEANKAVSRIYLSDKAIVPKVLCRGSFGVLRRGRDDH